MARNDDMDWLYRNQPEVEQTAILRPEDASVDDGHPGERVPPRERVDAAGAPGPSRQRPAPAGVAAPPPPRTPGPPPTPSQAPRPGRKRGRPVLTLLLTLFVAWLIFLIGAPLYAWTTGAKVSSTPEGDRPADQPGTTVLLVGSDAREDLTPEQRKKLGTGSTEGRRTDTMMLLHTPKTGKPVLLSLPRDSYLAIPGHKKNKLNAAYAFGGAPLLVQTIEQNTGVRIDGYLEVGFVGVVDVVDAVGGVTVCPDFDINDKDSHLKLSKGCQSVDGVTALGYARMRKQDPRGDLGRVERQREVIGAIGKAAATPMSVINPVRYWQLNMAVAKSVAQGDDTGIGTMTQVGSGFLATMTGSGISMTVPISNADAKTSAGSAVIWDEKASAEVFKAIAAGDTTDLEKYRK